MPPVRKKPRSAAVAVLQAGCCDRRGIATQGGNLDQSADVVVGSEDDHSAGAPGAAARIRCVGQYDWRTSRCVDLLQLPAREKGEVAALRRPKWKGPALASWHRPRGRGRKRANPQLALAI